MGLQLVFVVESNKTCRSDWIYIKDTIKYFYEYDRTRLNSVPYIWMERESIEIKKKKKNNLLINTALHVDKNRLSADRYRKNASNILIVLDKNQELIRKK